MQQHSTLPQMQDLVTIDEDVTNDKFGTYIDKRSIEQLLNYGLILLDKPPGPTSHEVVAWTKRILKINKAGHSGTLDPQVTGVLPIGLGDATKALGVLLFGPKQYIAVGRLHSMVPQEKFEKVLAEFTGEIYQKPPQRSSVLRRTRTRTIHELELLEQKERLFVIRVLCESGTYIRKLIYDIGEVLAVGATMIELRRTSVNQFSEETSKLVTLHELADAFAMWEEKNTESKIGEFIIPIEHALSRIKTVVIRDSAVDALCHGAQLAIPGILQISPKLEKNEIVAIYTQKGEVVALAESILSGSEIVDSTKGFAFKTKRIIMAPNTYQKSWHTTKTPPTQSNK